MNAQRRLYPRDRTTVASINSDVIKMDSLLLNAGNFDGFAFMFLPPYYYGESACYYDAKDSVMVLKVAKHSLRDRTFEQFIFEYYCSISPKALNSIRRLLYAAVFSSSFFDEPRILDGYSYQILVKCGSYRPYTFVAECCSPDKDSNCGDLVEILKSLSDAVKNNKPQVIDNLIPLADELTLKFKSLYPEGVKENSQWYED